MSIFSHKPAPSTEPMRSAKATIQRAVSQRVPPSSGHDALSPMGTYHYARGPLQRRVMETTATDAADVAHPSAPPAGVTHGGGLPINLRTGIEALSGLSLDDVRVHYNSPKPAQLHAHAYAQGNDIHLAAGQERHLPHEAWHLVQQREGRVLSTGQVGGQPLNDDVGLEREADVMGRRATSPTVQQRMPPKERSLPLPANPPVQGYFTDEGRRKNIFAYENAPGDDIAAVRSYLTARAPDLIEGFDALANDTETSHGTLQAWLRKSNLPVLELLRFPQTRNIPPSWITSTSTPNDGGPPILVEPDDIDSPASSQELDIALPREPLATDMVIDLTRDELPYHRGGTIPVSNATRREVRASAMLTNEYVDFSTTPLIGRGTESLKKEASALRKRARAKDKVGSKGKTYSHHPDTFWTGQPHSAMGWHPVSKHTNTLDGDYQKLEGRGGRRLTGLVVKEKSGYTRPTLEAYNQSKRRRAKSGSLLENVDGAHFMDLVRIHGKAKALAVTPKAQALWTELDRALDYIDDVIDRGDGHEMAKRAAVYLEIGFDVLPKSTSAVGELLDAIANRLKILKITGPLMEQIDGADLPRLTAIHEEAGQFAVTRSEKNLWRALGDVLNTLPVVIDDGEADQLAEKAAYYLDLEFNNLTEINSEIAELLYAIADALKEL